MKLNSRHLVERPAFRYLVVGGSVFLFEMAIIVIGQQLGASPVMAVAISFCLGTIVSFLLQKLITFKDTRMHHKVLLPQFIATVILVIWNFIFTLAVAKLLVDHAPTMVSRTIALAITTCWNFYLYKTRIFIPDGNPIY